MIFQSLTLLGQRKWPAIARLEDLHHWPNLKQLERAAAAIGQRLVISMEPAYKSLSE